MVDASLFTPSAMRDALDRTIDAYQASSAYQNDIKIGQSLYKVREDAQHAYGNVNWDELPRGLAKPTYNVDSRGTYGATVGAANAIAEQQTNNMKQRMRNANKQKK